MSPVNLDRIQSWIDQGRLDPSKPITMKELHKSRCLHGVKRHGVKLLGRVRLTAFPNLKPFLLSSFACTRNPFRKKRNTQPEHSQLGAGCIDMAYTRLAESFGAQHTKTNPTPTPASPSDPSLLSYFCSE